MGRNPELLLEGRGGEGGLMRQRDTPGVLIGNQFIPG